jgi:Fur family transcriptional regulator, zinc uptake regulator
MSESHLACAPPTVSKGLKEAEAMCAVEGWKLTPIRRRVLELLLQSPGPAKAYDLMAGLGETGAAKPPTVYRALDFLLEAGLAHRIESLNAYVACGHWAHAHVAVFLICQSCQNVQELHAEAAVRDLETEIRATGFLPKRTVVESIGLCTACVA